MANNKEKMKVLATAIATIGATVGAGVAVAGDEIGTVDFIDPISGKPIYAPIVNRDSPGSLTFEGWPAKWIKVWTPVDGVSISPEGIHIDSTLIKINSTLIKLGDIKRLEPQ